MNSQSFSSFVRSKLFAGIVTGIGIMLILIVVFEAGVAVGFHEALFSSRWGQNYSKNFGGSNMDMPGEHDPDSNGTFGKILSVSSSTLVIASAQKPEQRITLDSNTIIRDHQNTIQSSSLVVGEDVVVLGQPTNDGEIDASLIRVVPAAPEDGTASSSLQ